jgi:hypothetical protein
VWFRAVVGTSGGRAARPCCAAAGARCTTARSAIRRHWAPTLVSSCDRCLEDGDVVSRSPPPPNVLGYPSAQVAIGGRGIEPHVDDLPDRMAGTGRERFARLQRPEVATDEQRPVGPRDGETEEGLNRATVIHEDATVVRLAELGTRGVDQQRVGQRDRCRGYVSITVHVWPITLLISFSTVLTPSDASP